MRHAPLGPPRDSGQPTSGTAIDSARRRLTEAEQRLARHHRAFEAGVDPGALVHAVNTAHQDKIAAERALAQAEAAAPPPPPDADALAQAVEQNRTTGRSPPRTPPTPTCSAPSTRPSASASSTTPSPDRPKRP